MENFRHAFDMESYVYYTQMMQAECLAAAYRCVHLQIGEEWNAADENQAVEARMAREGEGVYCRSSRLAGQW